MRSIHPHKWHENSVVTFQALHTRSRVFCGTHVGAFCLLPSCSPPSHTLGPTSPHPHAHCQDNRLSGPCWSRRPALPRRKRTVSAPGVAPPPRAGLVPGLAQRLKPFTFTLARGDRRWGGRKLTAAMPRPHLCPIAFPRRGLVLRWHWESVAGFSDVWPTPL